eukprot:TRINITY_DN1812_c0_g1_i1.p1 TRINITY_DN1812_c0_g1~~TRINITY_DN1812_c0_g1_i1.p1  ORF type:complete len:606 (+),score=253.35 TRINITY_DN1812_c0_g1_i1:235-2052(+)
MLGSVAEKATAEGLVDSLRRELSVLQAGAHANTLTVALHKQNEEELRMQVDRLTDEKQKLEIQLAQQNVFADKAAADAKTVESNLTKQLERAQREGGLYLQERNMLQSDNKSLQSELSSRVRQLQQEKALVEEELERQTSERKRQVTALQSELDEMSARLAKVTSEGRVLTQKLDNKAAEVRRLEDELSSKTEHAQRRVTELTIQAEELQNKLERYEQAPMGTLTLSTLGHPAKKPTSDNRHQLAVAETRPTPDADKFQLSQPPPEFADRVQQLEFDLERLRQAKLHAEARLTEKIVRLEAEKLGLQEELATSDTEHQTFRLNSERSLKTQKTQFAAQLDKLRADARKKQEALVAENAELEATVEPLRQQIHELETTLQETQYLLGALQHESEQQLREHVHGMREVMHTARREFERQEEDMKLLSSHPEGWSQSKQRELKQLQTWVETMRRDQEQLNREKTELRAELDRVQQGNAKLKIEVAVVVALKRELQELRSAFGETRRLFDDLRRRVVADRDKIPQIIKTVIHAVMLAAQRMQFNKSLRAPLRFPWSEAAQPNNGSFPWSESVQPNGSQSAQPLFSSPNSTYTRSIYPVNTGLASGGLYY